MKAGLCQLWELMWWWIPSPSESQAGSGSLPGVMRMLPGAALSALLTGSTSPCPAEAAGWNQGR